MPITPGHTHHRVTLYLGNGKDAVHLKSDLMSALGGYVHRVANSAKDLDNYPLVFTDKTGLQNFLAMRNAYTSKSNDSKPVMTGNVDTDVGLHVCYTLRNVRAMGAHEFTFSPEQTIDIVGHGATGLDRIVVDNKVFTMKDIGRIFSDIGVPRDIRDVRLTCCHSADATTVPDIKEPGLTIYSRPVAEKSSFMGIPYGNIVRMAPAEHLVDALAECNFNRVTVTGYHGAGVYYNGLHFPEHNIRNTKTPSEPGYDPSATVRRSTVAERFTSV